MTPLNEIQLYDLITDLSVYKGKEKLAHLKELRGTELVDNLFNEFCVFVYDKKLSFHIKKFEKVELQSSLFDSVNSCSLRDMYKELLNIDQKGSCTDQDKYNLNLVYSSLSPYAQKMAQMILDRNMRCGVSLSTLQKLYGNEFLAEFPIMLCSSYNLKKIEENITYPAYSQLKSDGARAVCIDCNTFKSRNGKVYYGLVDLIETMLTLYKDFSEYVFDGELVVVDEFGEILPRTTGNGILNKSIQGTITAEEASRVRFIVWDAIPKSVYFDLNGLYVNVMDYDSRFKLASSIVNSLDTDFVRLQETRIVNSLAEAKAHFFELTQKGEEGTILKDKSGIWSNTNLNGNSRPLHQFKFKEEHDGDFEIIDWYYGKLNSKYEDVLAGFTIKTACGKVMSNVGSGLNDDMRQIEVCETLKAQPSPLTSYKEIMDSMYLGKIVTLTYNARETKDGSDTESLFLPRVVEVRSDKTQADTRDDLIAQEKASRELKL